METSSVSSPYFLTFLAAQVKLGDKGFLSRDFTVQDLILNKSDVHHLFPRNLLKKQGLSRYNQIANFAVAQSEINIKISDRPPSAYFAEVLAQCDTGVLKFGGITDRDELMDNLRQRCIPDGVFGPLAEHYETFLQERRRLMAEKVRQYFSMLPVVNRESSHARLPA
jgi:hypothetical protein